jgi:hypothetical protein
VAGSSLFFGANNFHMTTSTLLLVAQLTLVSECLRLDTASNQSMKPTAPYPSNFDMFATTNLPWLISLSLEVIAACGKGRLLPKNFRGPLPVWTFDRVEGDDPAPRSPKPFLVPVEKFREILIALQRGARNAS